MSLIREKGLPTSNVPKKTTSLASAIRSTILVVGLVGLSFLTLSGDNYNPLSAFTSATHPHALILKDQCAQVDPILPKKTSPALDELLDTISTPLYKNLSIGYLSNAVKIPTVSRDVMGEVGVFSYFKNTLSMSRKDLELSGFKSRP
jgi:hypothetical protein